MGIPFVSLTGYEGERRGRKNARRNEFIIVCYLKETYSVEEHCSKIVLNTALIENMSQTTILMRIARVETFQVATSVGKKFPYFFSLI